MKITKKVCIYILVGLITITGTFTSFYKGAYAFEYVGGALAFEEAIKWLLASVGIISVGGMTADYWENHSQEFEDYCAQQNITDTEVANWQLKLCEGILDKASDCWVAFKNWASTLTGSGSGSGSSTEFSNASGMITSIFPDFDTTKLGIPNKSVKFAVYSISGNIYTFHSWDDKCSFIDCYQDGNNKYYLRFSTPSGYNSQYNIQIDSTNLSLIGQSYSNNSSYELTNNLVYYCYNIGVVDQFPFLDSWGASSGSVTDSDFISVQPDVTDLDIISSPIPDTDAQEVAIPMPGVSDSDNEASADAYDNIVDQVNDGTLELDDAITQVIDTLKIIVYEQETEKIFPKPDNEEDQEDLDDKINENKDNMGFTLGGLETVFPFCIPWDIYAFINLLRADPVPPKIELPFPNPLDPENPWTVEVDFSDWDDGMKIVRLAEDFLFIIGLAVLTRSLIGAGGGDG